jgi:hypothetical protein
MRIALLSKSPNYGFAMMICMFYIHALAARTVHSLKPHGLCVFLLAILLSLGVS